MKTLIDSFLSEHEQDELQRLAGVPTAGEDESELDALIIEANSDRRGYGSRYEELVVQGLHPNLAAQVSRMAPRQSLGWNW